MPSLTTDQQGAGPRALVALVLTWVGSVTLSEWSTFVSILSGLAVLVYTVAMTYLLWRDKIRRKQHATDKADFEQEHEHAPPHRHGEDPSHRWNDQRVRNRGGVRFSSRRPREDDT